MIRIFADDAKVWLEGFEREGFQNNVLIYDSRQEDYDLVKLTVTTGLNVAGTAEIVMPATHPAYNVLHPYKTLIRIYRDDELRFRGRVLYSTEDIVGQKTITCEGEMGLLHDSIYRPYQKVGATPASFFTTMINAHNSQVEVAKQFTVGRVTVSGSVIEMENENAEPVLDAVNNLVEQVGGYITFTDADDGTRVINWLADIGATSGQTIEFGENLLDYSSTGANTTELATGLIPYGAKIEGSNERITIKAAANSGGKDYILNGDAVFERGTIMMTKVWDDVTTANELYNVALAWFENTKPWMFVSSLDLTAFDLSYLDKSIDSFAVGDMVRVVSKPHRVDAMLQITQMTEDLLDPAQSKVTLGKDIVSLTGTNVAEEKKGQAVINGVMNTLGSFNLSGYATKKDLNDYAPASQMMEAVGQAQLAASSVVAETAARKALVDNIDDETHVKGGAVHIGEEDTEVVHLRSTDRVKVHNRMHMVGSMLDFDNNQGVRCYNNDGETVVYILRTDSNNNTIVGTANNKLYLRGPTVYFGPSNAVVTSDRRNKHSIEELPDAYVEALDKMTPVRFKYNDGTSDRYHVGFIAQDVEAALTEAGLCGKDFGGFVDLNGDGEVLGLAYDEFIGLLFQKIRKLEQKIEKMESDSR